MRLEVTLYTTVSNFTSAPTSKDVYYITSEQLEQGPFDIRKSLPSGYHPYIRKIVATLSADRQQIEISSEEYGNRTLGIGKDDIIRQDESVCRMPTVPSISNPSMNRPYG